MSYKMVLNTACSIEKVPDELKSFYNYVHSGIVSANDKLVIEIQSRIDDLKGKQEVQQIMTLYEDFQIMRKIEYKQGIEEGKAIGVEEGKSIGIQEGKTIGIEEGVRIAKIDAARNMKELGIDISVIAKSVDLPLEEIEKL